jgi:S-adenosylmethionine decarboxylase
MSGTVGTHILADLWGVGGEVLDDGDFLQETMVSAAEGAGLHVISSHFHRFEPHGISGVIVLAESHATIHTWPEQGLASMDIFTCGDGKAGDDACKRIVEALRPQGRNVRRINRGVSEPGGEVS